MLKIGSQIPYFEFLDGLKGKNLYDLKQKYHIVIYRLKDDFLEDMEDEFEKGNIKLINDIQITSKDFFEKIGLADKEEFIIIADRFGTIQYISDKVPSFEEIMNIIFFAENEGCCSL